MNHRDILLKAINDCSHDELRDVLHAMLEAGDAGRLRHHKDGSRCWSLTCERAHHLVTGQLQIPPELEEVYGRSKPRAIGGKHGALVQKLQQLHAVPVYSNAEWAASLGVFVSALKEAGFTEVRLDHEDLSIWLHEDVLIYLNAHGSRASLRVDNEEICSPDSPDEIKEALFELPELVKKRIAHIHHFWQIR